MIMGSVEYIDDISKASTALVIFAFEPAACGPIRASLEFHNEAVVAKPHRLQVQSDGKQGISISERSFAIYKVSMIGLTNMRL
jgi:hypothetical protein